MSKIISLLDKLQDDLFLQDLLSGDSACLQVVAEARKEFELQQQAKGTATQTTAPGKV